VEVGKAWEGCGWMKLTIPTPEVGVLALCLLPSCGHGLLLPLPHERVFFLCLMPAIVSRPPIRTWHDECRQPNHACNPKVTEAGRFGLDVSGVVAVSRRIKGMGMVLSKKACAAGRGGGDVIIFSLPPHVSGSRSMRT